MDTSTEVQAQIAFADVILLNKIDLVRRDELDRLERAIRAINAAATIVQCRDAAVAMDAILDVGGFDLARAKTVAPRFLEPEYPFESIGIYRIPAGRHELRLAPGPDPSIRVALFPVTSGSPDALTCATESAVGVFSGRGGMSSSDEIAPANVAHELVVGTQTTCSLVIPSTGSYALVTQHLPEEFALEVRVDGAAISPETSRTFKPDHQHDANVSSVGLRATRPVNPDAVTAWLQELVAAQGTDIYRAKGILDVADHDERWVFQGVHMLLRGQPGRAWEPGEERASQLVFIGRNLDRAALDAGFAACLT